MFYNRETRSILLPTCLFKNVSYITPAFLKKNGIKALVLDVDNTLTSHNSQQLAPEISAWLQAMHDAGIKLAIASNNTKKRVIPFAKAIGLDFVANSAKPLPYGFMRAQKLFGVAKNEMALVGDQIFTDVMGANLYGIKCLMVEPLAPEIKASIAFKRKLEKPIMAKYHKNGGAYISAKEKQ
ncbi:MAG: YqeG family HAD IIIA-type phosphatase [Oscillospiraceae bacterium]|nr:YqeG family HAD IIIA-type phosphatase [Oscillospiraceae bacterium]